MSFDQEIYRIQNEIQERACRQETPVDDKVPSIYDEVTTLAGVDYHFAERAFFDGALNLRIPEEFILLGQETMKRFLPASRDGQLLLSDEEGLFTISLLKQNRKLEPKGLAGEKDKYCQVLPKLAAGVHIHAAEILEGKEQSLVWLEYTNETVTERMYNCLFSSGLGSEAVTGSISFTYARRNFREIAKQIALSYKDNTAKGD
ncbi:hypothetical protein SAMN05216582_12835 [Selenomonas ruminantium]|uniref:Uncharacterized protein n=1 Tax=Selenomonas ruminantium TaxID=971 RepID=A0A1M6WUV9_SELRU|nr:hypothetical protein [Selenomonas ruminantium]SHK97513.1 hypothetical protein SAMN05216582_12835 [Selenomonas ruminantium]